MGSEKTVQVALPIPSEQLFTYSVPEHLIEGIALGKRVFVPFGKRKAIGYVVGDEAKQKIDFKLKDVIDILDESPLFDEKRLGFLRRVSEYYMTSLGIVLKFAHPLGLGKSVAKTVRITERGKVRLRSGESRGPEKKILQTLSLEPQLTLERALDLSEGVSIEKINSVQRKGYVEFDYRVVSGEKKKYEKIYSCSCQTEKVLEVKKKKPAKGTILEFIYAHGSVAGAELKDIFGGFSSHIKWLLDNELVSLKLKEIGRDPYASFGIEEFTPSELTQDQEMAVQRITPFVEKQQYRCFLLHGVTGSGKTEVYIRIVSEVIRKKKQAVIMVPEIALTPLLVRRFRSRFGKVVSVLHSLLSEGDRFDVWRRVRSGDISVVIGPRSVVFAPFPSLGLVVVDEEHDSSYKQSNSPCYNARDTAVMLGSLYQCPVILGSATPSLESYANSLQGKYEYLLLPARVGKARLPEVKLVDMKNVKEKIFSPTLKDALLSNFDRGEQSVLFINRRGFSNFLVCSDCGDLFKCPNCSTTVTFHKKDNSIRCHYCGIKERFANICVDCGGMYMAMGLGTQRVEEETRKILPSARVSVMDRDSAGGKTKLLNLYRSLESGKIDVLIGTQMIAKGHDLPGVTLVGVVSADHMLAIPDFRSGERTFQMLTQVAGRTGRGTKPGRVVLQTYNPEHPSVEFAVTHNSSGFLQEELELRKSLDQPPFTRLVSIRINGMNEEKTKIFTKKAKRTTEKLIRSLSPGALRVLGPSEAPIYKMKNRFRWQIILTSQNLATLRKYSRALYNSLKKDSEGISLMLDIDPHDFI